MGNNRLTLSFEPRHTTALLLHHNTRESNLETCGENGFRVCQQHRNHTNRMSTSAIVSVSNLDINKVTFGEIRPNAKGGKTVPIKYSGQNFQIRIPKAMYAMGVNIKENDNGTSYQMSLTLKGCDPYAKERAGSEAGEFGTLYNFLLDMQNKLLDSATTNSTKWFGKARSREVLLDTLKQFLSPSVEKVDGAWVPSGKYPPSFRMKVPVYSGVVSMDVVGADGKPIAVDLDNIESVFPKRCEASIVVTPSVYVSGQGWGVTWRITYARVTPPQRMSAAQVFADEIDQETPAAPLLARSIGGGIPPPEVLDEEVPQEESVQIPQFVEAPAPAPAPVATKAKSRRTAVPA